MKKILIIIPAYNEALNLPNTINDIKCNCNYDYIIINDCSRDNTIDLCKKNGWNYLSLPVNYGLTSGVQLGMKYAYANNYDIAIQFDGDGQHQAKYLSGMVDNIVNKKNNVVIGSRFITEKKNRSLRMFGNSLISSCIKLITGKSIKDSTSGMRAYDKKIISEFIKNPSLTPEPDTLVYLLKKGYKIDEVQVSMKNRQFGKSYLNLTKSIEYMATMIFTILFVRSFTRKVK
jgi:glycosyltransferase involved in cell wall biosynthesis